MKHTCHALGCTAEVAPHLLMCRPHWSMIPYHLQRRIWTTYRPDQEVTNNPSQEYLEAQRAAIQAVAAEEERHEKPNP